MLVRVFVDASPHIPEHRQLPLFTHLITTVGSTQFLHTAVILLLEKHVVHGPASPDENQVSFSMSTVLCKSDANEIPDFSGLLEEISLETIFCPIRIHVLCLSISHFTAKGNAVKVHTIANMHH